MQTDSKVNMELSLETISEDGFPYQKYLDGIKNKGTRMHYNKSLHLFLKEIPDHIYEKLLDSHPDPTDESRAEFFVRFTRKHPKMGSNIIAEWIKIQKSRAELNEISPNTVPNYVKPIKVLLDQNDIPILWKKLYNMYPREIKCKDRAYTTTEIQNMLEVCPHIVDKVIITMHASAGFRLEAWDYFTWSDVVIFKNKDSKIQGGALRIYHGDPEEYWTHLTPEACNFIELYRLSWTELVGAAPKQTDPLIRSPKYLSLTRLNQKGVRKRVDEIVKDIGLRPQLTGGKKRHEVKLIHGFRKFFNTMLRRAKVDFADKEKLMGHKIGLEDSYERYVEADFELFPEYQKAIPFLTISNEERATHESQMKSVEISALQKEKEERKQKEERLTKIEDILVKIVEKNLLNATPENKEMMKEFMQNHKKLTSAVEQRSNYKHYPKEKGDDEFIKTTELKKENTF